MRFRRSGVCRFRLSSIAPEHDARQPPCDKRHGNGRKAIEEAMLARGGGYHLFESEFENFEGRIGTCDLSTIDEKSHINLVAANRSFCGQRYRGAIKCRRQERHAVRLLLIEPVLAPELEKRQAERIITRRIRNCNGSALKQNDVV